MRKTKLSVTIDAETVQALREVARAERRSVSSAIDVLVAEAAERRQSQPGQRAELCPPKSMQPATAG